jgi:hypothetical protein
MWLGGALHMPGAKRAGTCKCVVCVVVMDAHNLESRPVGVREKHEYRSVRQ